MAATPEEPPEVDPEYKGDELWRAIQRRLFGKAHDDTGGCPFVEDIKDTEQSAIDESLDNLKKIGDLLVEQKNKGRDTRGLGDLYENAAVDIEAIANNSSNRGKIRLPDDFTADSKEYIRRIPHS